MQYLYDDKGNKYKVKYSAGISENPNIWKNENILIDNETVTIYYCTDNYRETTKGEYKHFVWEGNWFKIENNFKNMLMPSELYTYKYYVNNIKKTVKK